MSTVGRVGRLEGAQASTQIILGWLERVHAWPNLDAFVRAQLHGGESDIVRLRSDIDRTVANQSLPVDERDRVWQRMSAEVRFLRRLAILVDVAALRSIDRFLARLDFLEMAVQLDGLLRVARRIPPGLGTPPPPPDPPAERLPELAERLLAGAEVELRATAQIEARYYSGRSVLFPDTEAGWTDLQSQVKRIPQTLEIPDGRDRRRGITRRVRHRVSELVDEARMDTFEAIGRHDLAARIAGWQLGGDRPPRGRLVEPVPPERGSREYAYTFPSEWLEGFVEAQPPTYEPDREAPAETP